MRYLRPRTYGYDYAYGIAHAEQFPRRYGPVGDFKVIDIDWAEFCAWCGKPVMVYEMTRDTAEDSTGAGTKPATVTSYLAARAGIPAYTLGVYVSRPPGVQAELDRLNTRILSLTRQYPLTRLCAQQRVPSVSGVITYEPDEWWELIAICHSEHYANCASYPRRDELPPPGSAEPPF